MKSIDDITVRISNTDRNGNNASGCHSGSAEGRNPDLRVFSGSLEAALWIQCSKGRFRINRWWEQEDEERFTPNLKSPDLLQLPHLCAELAYYYLFFEPVAVQLRRKLAMFLRVLEPVCLTLEDLGISRHVFRTPVGEVPTPDERKLVSVDESQPERRKPHGKR